ncbi:hypothetical protein D9M71_452880 [compost metagenome]
MTKAEEHTRRNVQTGVQATEDRDQHNRVHHVARIRNLHQIHGCYERRVTCYQGVPGDDADDQQDGANIEGKYAHDHRAGHAGDAAGRLVGFGCRDRGDFCAADGEDHHGYARNHGLEAERHESAMVDDVAKGRCGRGDAQCIGGGDHDEDDDRGDLQ